jgi:hypothetical protein
MTSTRIIVADPEATHTPPIVPREQDRRMLRCGSSGVSSGGDLDTKHYVGSG